MLRMLCHVGRMQLHPSDATLPPTFFLFVDMSSPALPLMPIHLRPVVPGDDVATLHNQLDTQQEWAESEYHRACQLAQQLDGLRADLAARDEQLETVGAVNVTLQRDLQEARRQNEAFKAQLDSVSRAAAEAASREAVTRHQMDGLRTYAMQESAALRAQLHFAMNAAR